MTHFHKRIKNNEKNNLLHVLVEAYDNSVSIQFPAVNDFDCFKCICTCVCLECCFPTWLMRIDTL